MDVLCSFLALRIGKPNLTVEERENMGCAFVFTSKNCEFSYNEYFPFLTFIPACRKKTDMQKSFITRGGLVKSSSHRYTKS